MHPNFNGLQKHTVYSSFSMIYDGGILPQDNKTEEHCAVCQHNVKSYCPEEYSLGP